jgi:hypothetical protein
MQNLAQRPNQPLPPHWSAWLKESIWPQIHVMMLHDAYFKLFGHVHELTGQFNGPFAELVISGYVSNQTVTIRRLCDNKRDVISLRRLLEEVKNNGIVPQARSKILLNLLDGCDHVCTMVNDHIAHTANQNRNPDISAWSLQNVHIVNAQKSICKVAQALTRDILKTTFAHIIPVLQYDFMREFKTMVPSEDVQNLFDFWHSHSAAVDRWCDEPLS